MQILSPFVQPMVIRVAQAEEVLSPTALQRGRPCPWERQPSIGSADLEGTFVLPLMP
jgi:hypothetical protein